MAHRRLRSLRRAAGSKQQEEQQQETVHKQRERFPGEAENQLVAFGLLPGDTLEAQLIQEMIEQEHGAIQVPQSDQTITEQIDALGLGERDHKPKKQLHDLAPA